MRQKIKEDMLQVLIYLFENYVIDDVCLEPAQEELTQELLNIGFAGENVDKAFTWLEKLLKDCEQEYIQHQGGSSIRVYTEAEQKVLQQVGQSLLSRLVNIGVLSSLSREKVIDRVMALESDTINLDHIKWVVLMVVSNEPGYENIEEWAEMILSEEFALNIH